MTKNLQNYIKNGKVSASDIATLCLELKDGDTLCLGGGIIEIFPDGAFGKYYCISNNDKGNKNIAFPLINKKGITVDGEGAELFFHGDILPFVIDNCTDITIKNLNVDYKSPYFAQAEIVEADENRTVLKFDGKDFFCKVKDGDFCFYSPTDGWEHTVKSCLSLEFDTEKRAPTPNGLTYFPYTGEPCDHGFLGKMYRDVKLKQLDENLIEMTGVLGRVHTVGNHIVYTHSGRKNPGFFITESTDTTLDSITMYHTAAMGVICQISENITLKNVYAMARKNSGRMMSVNADATHFVNCRGKITMDSCKFVNMMDDGCNIHGIFLKGVEKTSSHSFAAGYGHGQQVGINIYRPGDTAQILDIHTMEVLCELTVEKTEFISQDKLKVYTVQPMPEIPEDCIADNKNTAPDVHIVNCETGNNRPRGFLLASAGKILVENCTFYNMYSGIFVGSEAKDWYESGKTTDVIIRNNNFLNSAYAGDCAIRVCPNLPYPDKVESFHNKVTVENNTFTMADKRFAIIKNTDNIEFRNNRFICDNSLPSHGQFENGGVVVQKCKNTCIEAVAE